MLEHYFPRKEKREILERNFLASFIEEAACHYKEQDYWFYGARYSLICMSYFGNWLQGNNIPICQATTAHARGFTDQFVPPKFKHQPHKASTQKRPVVLAAARFALTLIWEKQPPEVRRSPAQIEVGRYVEHLACNRGLAEGSISNHARVLEEFLTLHFAHEEVKIDRLTPLCIRDYIAGLPRNRRKDRVCTVLRGYFRFLELQSAAVRHLAITIPTVPSHRPALSSRILTQEQLDQLLRSINRSTTPGKRNYAAILCMSDLGMRVGDVVRLSLDDIDWREGSVRVANHKQCRPYRLPIPRRLGEALSDYIANGRPASRFREVFLRHTQPFGIPASHHSLKTAIQRVWIKSGLYDRFSGTHILRHSAATRMKQNGIPLKSIADVLGHSSMQTTMLYAQVDLPALRRTAQPWPGGAK